MKICIIRAAHKSFFDAATFYVALFVLLRWDLPGYCLTYHC